MCAEAHDERRQPVRSQSRSDEILRALPWPACCSGRESTETSRPWSRRALRDAKGERDMDKELVIVVPSEAAAYEVVKALKGLDDEGAIELYSSTVVVKSSSGTFTIEDAHHLRPPWAAAIGVTTGALIGLLAGPVGMA